MTKASEMLIKKIPQPLDKKPRIMRPPTTATLLSPEESLLDFYNKNARKLMVENNKTFQQTDKQNEINTDTQKSEQQAIQTRNLFLDQANQKSNRTKSRIFLNSALKNSQKPN